LIDGLFACLLKGPPRASSPAAIIVAGHALEGRPAGRVGEGPENIVGHGALARSPRADDGAFEG